MSIETARTAVLLHHQLFRKDYYTWLNENWHVYEYFERSATKVWESGFKHYSHRTIWEVMRHRTNVREISGNFKLNDHYIRDCAQLYLLRHPEHQGLFYLKRRKAEIIADAAAEANEAEERKAA